jgi:hypothetical protein
MSKLGRYGTKPKEVMAVKALRDNEAEIKKLLPTVFAWTDSFDDPPNSFIYYYSGELSKNSLGQREYINISIGHYLVKDESGNYFTMKADEFNEKYNLLEEGF